MPEFIARLLAEKICLLLECVDSTLDGPKIRNVRKF